MGYTTEFEGSVRVDPPLNASEIAYLNRFSETRRMKRENGPLFTHGNGYCGQDDGPDRVLDYNYPDPSQPGLWCQWVPSDDGTRIEWNGTEKFYYGAEWMKYIVTELFGMNGAAATAVANGDPILDLEPELRGFTFDHSFNGAILAQGEDPEDRWRLVVCDNGVRVQKAKEAWGPEVRV